MFPTWAEQVEACGRNIKQLVALHVKRWEQWGKYITLINKIGYREMPQYRKERDWGELLMTLANKINDTPSMADELKFQKEFLDNLATKKSEVGRNGRGRILKMSAWSKRMFREGNDYVLLDASFGSLNTTSDLDINVVCTNPEVMDMWMKFTALFADTHGTAQSFCEFWDSNFYYEPGVFVRQGTSLGTEYDDFTDTYIPKKATEDTVKSIPALLMNNGFAWTSANTAMYELQCVDAYANAYERNKDILLDGFRASPNPFQFDKDKEQNCYKSSLHFAEAFRRAYEAYRVDPTLADGVRFAYLKYAVTKIEGLVSVTSLAVCKVFGKGVWHDYVAKTGKGKYLKPYMAGISAYEMLRNLQMHSHNLKYKSKYANRLVYVLMHNDNLCLEHYRKARFKAEDKYIDVPKSNDADLEAISTAIAFLLDFIDGHDDLDSRRKNPDYDVSKPESRRAKCEFLKKGTESWVKNLKKKLPELCRMTKEYVEGNIKKSTNVRNADEQEKDGADFVKGLIVE